MEFRRANRWRTNAMLSSEELNVIDAFKKEMHYVLHDHIESSFCMIDNHLEPHLYADARFLELQKMKNNILEGATFNSYYAGVVELKYPSFQFSNNDLFYHFVYWCELIQDDQIAISRLKQFIELQCIDYLLKQYETNPIFKEQNLEFIKPVDHYNSQYLNVFNPFGYELFNRLEKALKETEKDITVRYTLIFLFLKYNGNYVVDNAKNYRKFVQTFKKTELYDHVKEKEIKFSRLSELDANDDKYIRHEMHLKEIKKQFEKENKRMSSSE